MSKGICWGNLVEKSRVWDNSKRKMPIRIIGFVFSMFFNFVDEMLFKKVIIYIMLYLC